MCGYMENDMYQTEEQTECKLRERIMAAVNNFCRRERQEGGIFGLLIQN